MIRNLILILGDQLSLNLSSLRGADPSKDRILMAEVREEATYIKHHKKKIAFIFSAMRHHAEALRAQGWQVSYTQYQNPENTGSLRGEVARTVDRLGAERVIVTAPGEWRLREDMSHWETLLLCPVEIREDDRFVCSNETFKAWASGRKQLRMEYFYREMRKSTDLLMDGDKPAGGKWNYDADNRKAAKPDLFMPQPFETKPDAITRDVLTLVEKEFGDHFGDLEPFWFAVTARGAQAALDHFIEQALPNFGDYQDAMLEGEKFLYHSVLSIYLNVGLLDPLDICRRAEEEYKSGRAPLNSSEGFIRQIIGWREYVRGIYWLKMPDYAQENFFENERGLPEFYWTGKTEMACLRAAIAQTKEDAYAHHIQRLMVTGNFALLIGADPHKVHEWYLAVYADAFEWVELPNTIGMSQFGDGGLLASKPYASSGAYINRMSNHCKHCGFDVKKKTGDGACPFNALYWDFLHRNEGKLKNNPRMRQMYATWNRMSPEKQSDYLESAKKILDTL